MEREKINYIGMPLTKNDACVDVLCAAYMEKRFAGLAGGLPFIVADAGVSSAAVPTPANECTQGVVLLGAVPSASVGAYSRGHRGRV